jgi:hypothetical protein
MMWAFRSSDCQEDLIMAAIRILGLAAFLIASVASSVFGATGHDPNSGGYKASLVSPSSPPNTQGNRAGDSRLTDNPSAASLPGSHRAGHSPQGAKEETSDPLTGFGCGGGC